MIDKLKLLLGSWQGEGTAAFPTITQQDYLEQMTFAFDEPHNLIQYEQKTWRKESRKLLHWEFGFVRALEDGSLLLNNSQNNGRLELMAGQLAPLPDGFLLSLTTTLFGNDPRMVKATREWKLEGDQLTYLHSMATRTVPDHQPHLRAILHRC